LVVVCGLLFADSLGSRSAITEIDNEFQLIYFPQIALPETAVPAPVA
jgi:hypothetical protein